MAIVRTYADPAGLRAAPVYSEPVYSTSPTAAFDTTSLNFSYATNPALEGAVNTTFQDLLGRDATPEEIAKYGQTGTFVNSAENIYKDYLNEIPAESQAPEAEQGTSAYYNPAAYWAEDYTRNKAGHDPYMASIQDGYQTFADADAARFNNQDVAEFLTKMAPEQKVALFKDTGLSDEQSIGYSNWIDSQDWNGISSYDMQAKMGLNDDQMGAIGRAMFSDRELNTTGNRGGGRNDVEFQNRGNRYAAPDDADRNNQDYKKFTVYDPEQGLYFTGGHIPEKQKTDWMGNIVLGALLGGVGMVAGMAVGAAATAAGAGGTAATMGATGAVAGTGTAGMIGAAGGGAVAGGVGATMTGGDVGKGMLTGGVMGGLGAMGTPNITNNRMVDSTAYGAARGAIGSSLSGGDPLTGAVAGGVSSLTSPIVKQYVPGIAGDMVNRYVSTAIKTGMADTPERPSAPTLQQEDSAPAATTYPLTGAVDLNTTRRIIRR